MWQQWKTMFLISVFNLSQVLYKETLEKDMHIKFFFANSKCLAQWNALYSMLYSLSKDLHIISDEAKKYCLSFNTWKT